MRIFMFYGNTTEFDKANEDWVSYVEIMKLFFEANRIKDETQKKAIILPLSVGVQT